MTAARPAGDVAKPTGDTAGLKADATIEPMASMNKSGLFLGLFVRLGAPDTPSPRPKYRGGVEVWVEASVEALSWDFALVVASQEPFLRASGEADSGFHGRPSTNRPGTRTRRGPGRPNHPPPTFTWSPADASAAEGLRGTSRPFSARRCSRLCLQIECCIEVARG